MSRIDHSMDDAILGVSPLRKKYAEEHRLYAVMFWPTYKCFGGCRYCFNSSDASSALFLSKEIILKVIDEAQAFGVRETLWEGGDALLHPDIYEILDYNFDKGMSAILISSGLISKEEARRLTGLDNPGFEAMGIHIDTINQEAYNKVNYFPKTLEKKIEGYRNLLEAGFPAEKVYPCLTFTKPVVDSIEQTIDWFIDEMGAKALGILPIKPMGYGKGASDLEPGLSDIRRANEYRAKRLGKGWLRIGGAPASSILCRTFLTIKPDGDAIPCDTLMDMVIGNVYQEGLQEIFECNRDLVTFNHEIKGACGNCENNDICSGCRGMAYHYLGDMWESDPKCWLNTAAKEYYLRAD